MNRPCCFQYASNTGNTETRQGEAATSPGIFYGSFLTFSHAGNAHLDISAECSPKKSGNKTMRIKP
jgi:hypothetical protein